MTASPRAIELALAAAAAAAEKKAEDVLAIDVSSQMVITDVFVVASAPNDRQVRSIVDEVEERLRLLGAKPLRREGEREARWVLLDYAEIVVHVQNSEDRRYYALERLWRDCPSLDLSAVLDPRDAAGEREEAPELSRRDRDEADSDEDRAALSAG